MANFFAELKRRHIYRVAAAYAVVSWVLLQLFNNLTPVMRLPDWAGMLVLVFLVGGFPVAVIFAWIHELKSPESGASQRASSGRLDWALMTALVVVIALVSYQQLAPSRATVTANPQSGVESARAAATSPATAISIAVLPFTNLSSDKEQEFFSDGMTEEITSALAKIPDLRVVGRTSAFEFKGKNQDLRVIGQALSATHLLEGSVRKEGNSVRITAQLILAENGVHVWTESYNRELTGVFTIQEDIATAIAGALRMPLGLKPGEQLVSSRTNNLESYQQFLKLRADFRARGGNPNFRADLEQLVTHDPGFAPAWALMADVNTTLPNLDTRLLNRSTDETRLLLKSALDKAEKAAREAIRLDSRQANAYTALSTIEEYRFNWSAAEDFARQGLAVDPNDPDALANSGNRLARFGRMKEALRLLEQSHALEPFVPVYNIYLAIALLNTGQTDAAISVLEALPPDTAGFSTETLARAYAAAERYGEAADKILSINKNRFGDAGKSQENAAELMRSAPAKASVPNALPVLPGRLNFAYAYVGAPDRMMEYPERAFDAGVASTVRFLFSPLYAPVRKTERFKAYVRKLGLVDYWKTRGWPDLCRPQGNDDFVCD